MKNLVPDPDQNRGIGMSDHEMMPAIRDGNKDAFREVFHQCYADLCQYASTILKDMDEAEDVVQSMFIKIWEKRETLNVEHTIRTYLYKAVYNQCINLLDHRKIKLKHQEYGSYEARNLVQHPEVFPEELEAHIKAAINELPEQCRRVFILSRYEEMRYAEIAQQLKISVNTIENQISKALRILRLKLKDHIV
jgi:RNA polymerase sigma-70 factor, ECF subfamily